MSRKHNNHTGLKIVLILLILCFIAATAFVIKLSVDLAGETVPTQGAGESVVLPTRTETEPPATQAPTETTAPQPETVIATASISAQGDLLMHKPIFDDRSLVKQNDGSYDFSSIFRYFGDTVKKYDVYWHQI